MGARRLSEVVAETRKNCLRFAIVDADNFEPVILIRIAFQNDVDLSTLIDISEVYGRPFGCLGHIRIGFLERQFSQDENL